MFFPFPCMGSFTSPDIVIDTRGLGRRDQRRLLSLPKDAHKVG